MSAVDDLAVIVRDAMHCTVSRDLAAKVAESILAKNYVIPKDPRARG